MLDSFPQPAETWSEATDEHGNVVDETLPNFVYDEAGFRRWQLSLEIAVKLAQGAAWDTPECQALATAIYESPIATDAEPERVEESAVRGADRAVARQIKRLKDGTFAPKGLGQVLSPRSPGTGPRNVTRVSQLPKATREKMKRLHLDEFAKASDVTHSVLGKNVTETVGKYAPGSDPRKSNSSDYLPERQDLHRQIVDDLLADKVPQRDDSGFVQPTAYFMAGGTASGKSTFLRQHADELGLPPEESTVHVDPDQIKESLPEYQELKRLGDPYAAQAVHRESGDIARLAIDQATAAGFNVVIDGTGNSSPGEFVEQLTRMNENGYAVDVTYVDVALETATDWSLDRAERDGRGVPIPLVFNIHASVSRNFMDVVNLPFIRRLRLYERGQLVAEKTNSDEELRILRDDLFRAFLSKTEASGDNG